MIKSIISILIDLRNSIDEAIIYRYQTAILSMIVAIEDGSECDEDIVFSP